MGWKIVHDKSQGNLEHLIYNVVLCFSLSTYLMTHKSSYESNKHYDFLLPVFKIIFMLFFWTERDAYEVFLSLSTKINERLFSTRSTLYVAVN